MGLIVIDGLDGSGKATQVARIQACLKAAGKDSVHVNFPDYASPSSALIKMYLAGDFGENPKDTNPYAACTFYAVDRYASYKRYWKQALGAGKTVLCDRYTTSNIIYQMTKLPKNEWDGFIAWVEDTEYKKMGLPRPDAVLYLDMPPDISQGLMKKRYSGDESKRDIHEKNLSFLQECRECALYAAERLGWLYICCARDGAPKGVEEIGAEIMERIEAFI